MHSFKEKVVLITGGTSGIGFETARQFAKQGAKVVISGRDQDKGNTAVALLEKERLTVKFINVDVACAKSMESLISQVVDCYGRLDVAFNNAGIGGEPSPMHLQTEENWQQVIDINLKGVWLAMKFQIQQFLKQNDQQQYSIINMSSLWGVGASDFGVSPYVAAKHGVIGLTEAAALEYAKNNIRVNAVCPAWVHTPANDAVLGNTELKKQIAAHHPIKRLGKTSEIASAVLWLASEGAGFVTGHSMVLDGGISARR